MFPVFWDCKSTINLLSNKRLRAFFEAMSIDNLILLQQSTECITLTDVPRTIAFGEPFYPLLRRTMGKSFLIHIALRPFLNIIVTYRSRSFYRTFNIARFEELFALISVSRPQTCVKISLQFCGH